MMFMNDGDYRVDILDSDGKIVDQKLRRDIIKGLDVYHAVYCVLVTPDGNIAISKIAQRIDMPNLHAGSYGATAATIKRVNETGDQAMARALKNELNIATQPEKLFEQMIDIDNTRRLLAVYTVKFELPTNYSREDIDEIVAFTPDEFEQLLADPSLKTTQALSIFWEEYKKS
jgi:hypothetical protein